MHYLDFESVRFAVFILTPVNFAFPDLLLSQLADIIKNKTTTWNLKSHQVIY